MNRLYTDNRGVAQIKYSWIGERRKKEHREFVRQGCRTFFLFLGLLVLVVLMGCY